MNKSQIYSANKWLQRQRHVWIKAIPAYPNKNEDAFLQGKVLQIYEKQILVELIDSQKKVKAPIENILKLTYGPSDVPDMVDLEQLNQPQLLYNIKRRYINDQIFTYCGPTLVIINPYIFIEKLFNDTQLQDYQTMVFTDNLEYKSMQPHVFGLAAFCLWQLFDNQRNQSIVISGQSGAGKTENTKYCLKFLASLGKNMKQLVNDPNKADKNKKINYQNMRTVEKTIKRTNSRVFGIEQKILGCNQILQAFGNSKTIRNDNSSRFGKLILLVYGQTQIDIKSAFIISYLLQKSRIVSVSDGQRNYHIFYYFCKGTTPEQKKQYKLNDPIDKYHYLSQSTTYDLPKCSDVQKFMEIKKQFSMYLIPEETDAVYRVISIVLNIGNTLFKKGENKNNQEIATITNQQYIRTVTQLLQVDYEEFKHCFEYKTRKTGASVINSPLKYDQAIALRDSFAKNIYEKVFNFLVAKLNEKIEIEKIDFEGAESRDKRKSIGLLDIFGFEVLLLNSLEQFFINFANQKLQQLYVSYIFKEEQNQFLRQGLKQFSHDIGFQDNKPIIDLFELYPLGIFHLINQSSQLNKPDENLPQAIVKNHKTPVITIPKSKKSYFQINHSCSPVNYNTSGFTAKNKDQFPKQLLEVIKTTKNQYMRKIVVGDEKQQETKGKKATSKFLGSKFLAEMNRLTQELYSCDCHFVRCIKPNSKKEPKLFNSEAVLQSLRYLGVLDSIKIRKLGYIYRRPYRQFYKKFYELQRYIFSYQTDIQGKHEEDFKEECRRILQKFAKKQLQDKDILFGVKKILIKESALNHLQLLAKEKRRLRIHTANRVKVMYKNAVFRMQVKKFFNRIAILKDSLHKTVQQARQSIMNKKVTRVQNVIRKYLWYLRLERIKQQATKSVTKISAYYKMKKQRRWFLQLRKNILNLQVNIRCYLSMNKFFKERMCASILKVIFNKSWDIIRQKKALMIQKTWKGYKVRKQFQKTLRLLKVRAFVKRAIIRFRKNAFSQMLQIYKKPIFIILAIVRGRVCTRNYQKLQKSTLLLQKAYRRHLHKRFYLEKIWKKQRQTLEIIQSQKERQLKKIGIVTKVEQKLKIKPIQTSALVQKFSPMELKTYFKPYLPQQPRDMRINETISFPDKNTFQTYLGDIDILSTLTYKGNWATKYAHLKTQMVRKQEYPLKIDISEALTCVTTNKDRIYSFSEYVKGEENQFHKTEIKTSVNSVCVNDESVYIVTKQFDLYEWGDNKNGELFMETQEKVVRFTNNSSVNSVKDVQIKGKNKFYVDYQGRSYQKRQNTIKLVRFPPKTQINYIISSYSFTHFLTLTGNLYSFGSNKFGQLGLDSLSFQISVPTLNQYFIQKKETIESVSVGMGHTVVKTKLGYVYTWGDNRAGQVSHQSIDTIRSPVSLELDKQKIKVLQAVASIRTTYLLTESLVILGLGISSSFDTTKSSNYSQMDLLNVTNSNPKNLIPVKISISWNRQMSLLTVNCIQQNKCKPNTKPDVIFKYCKLIAKDWPHKSIYPQYCEWMDNILNLSDMRKFKFQKNVKPKPKAQDILNNSKKMNSDLDELKILMDLRKTSTLFKNEARKKIEQVIKKLGNKSQEQWTKQDEQISIYIRQYCKVVLK